MNGLREREDGARWRGRLHEIIFEADTPAGRLFDIGLIGCILSSLVVVMLESVSSVRADYGALLIGFEWGFTILFTVEYVLRILAVRLPWRYATSFFGVIDLISIVPTYLSLVVAGAQSLLVIRTLRLLRVFRVLKLARFLSEASVIVLALRASIRKIIVFLFAVVCLATIAGALMFLLEGPEHGFTSIPRSMFWAIVTMTTVGYGTVVPETVLGQGAAAILMIMGYGIIAVPTGIVSAEFVHKAHVSTQACPACSKEGHDPDAMHCKFCGATL